MKPKLLDLYCKAGGCSKGYNMAGFDVVGVDIEDQPNYPFLFIRSDAIEYVRKNYHLYDVIHASPPCQKYSRSTAPFRMAGKKYPDLLNETRIELEKTGKPYIIENVPGSPMRKDLILNGEMFGLKVIRNRWFELGGGLFILCPPKTQIKKNLVRNGERVSVFGNGSYRKSKFDKEPIFKKGSVRETWAYAMGINWMTCNEMSEAIPPAYTEYIGNRIKNQIFINH